jgi:hypothetical protein
LEGAKGTKENGKVVPKAFWGRMADRKCPEGVRANRGYRKVLRLEEGCFGKRDTNACGLLWGLRSVGETIEGEVAQSAHQEGLLLGLNRRALKEG